MEKIDVFKIEDINELRKVSKKYKRKAIIKGVISAILQIGVIIGSTRIKPGFINEEDILDTIVKISLIGLPLAIGITLEMYAIDDSEVMRTANRIIELRNAKE